MLSKLLMVINFEVELSAIVEIGKHFLLERPHGFCIDKLAFVFVQRWLLRVTIVRKMLIRSLRNVLLGNLIESLPKLENMTR